MMARPLPPCVHLGLPVADPPPGHARRVQTAGSRKPDWRECKAGRYQGVTCACWCGPKKCPDYQAVGGPGTVSRPDETPRADWSVDQMAEFLAVGPPMQPGAARDQWASWPNTRDAHVRLLRQAVERAPTLAGDGRGIVSCVSAKPGWSSGKLLDHGYFPAAWAMVRELRRLGCTLPVTFAHLGPVELDGYLRGLLAEVGVQTIDLRAWELLPGNRMRILAGWESKIAAVHACPYREVLFMDADNLPVRDPSDLFDSPEYQTAGAVFWPDIGRCANLKDEVWPSVGMQAVPGARDFESGQFLVDKARCFRGLAATRFLNEHSDWYYRFLFGDKSTFHLGFRAASDSFAMPAKGCRGTGASLIQYDFQGRDLFNHGTQNKPTLRGYKRPECLSHRAHCERHLAELRELWDGRLWSRTTDAATAAKLSGTRWVYDRVGIGQRHLTLGPAGTITEGAAGREQTWTVGDGPTLVVHGGDGKATMILTPLGNQWVGQWLEYERNDVVLTPAGAA